MFRVSGRAPNLRTWARAFASSGVKDPLICARPSLIWDWKKGAETTRPSRTMPNWFCGDGRLTSLLETSESACVPSASNSRFTTHPEPPCASSALALVIEVPLMKAGCRRYLAAPSWSQVTIHFSGSSGLPPCRLDWSVQSRLISASCSAGSLASAPSIGGTRPSSAAGVAAGVAAGLAASAGVACAVGDSVAAGLGVVSKLALPLASLLELFFLLFFFFLFPVVASVPSCVALVSIGPGLTTVSTGRKFSNAVCANCSASARSLTPGTETTIAASLPDPWMATSASATPNPLTRCRMISVVCCSCSSVIAPAPSACVGTRMT